jgi:Tol biopolymer transport system component
MARRTLYLPLMIAAAVLGACLVALLAVSEEAQAAFPGKNGRIAYQGSDGVIYTIDPINPDGGGKTEVTRGEQPSYSPDGTKIAFGASDGHDAEIYTVEATGGKPFQITDNAMDDLHPSYSPDGKRIAYTHYSDPDLPDEAAAIYKIAADGGKGVLVTANNGTGALYPSWGSRP